MSSISEGYRDFSQTDSSDDNWWSWLHRPIFGSNKKLESKLPPNGFGTREVLPENFYETYYGDNDDGYGTGVVGSTVFLGVYGRTLSAGYFRSSDANLQCAIATSCDQVGIGIFRGAFAGSEIGLANRGTLTEGKSKTFGLFYAGSAFGGILSSVDISRTSAAATGTAAAGFGTAGGIQFCTTTITSCVPIRE